MTTYVLGSEDPEIARLDAQAHFLTAATRILLQAAGATPGMRVLDLGTGLGHVALAAAKLVGPEGEVVGVDNSPRALELARARATDMPSVRFIEGDVLTWRDDVPFDAVVGRFILFQLADPVAVLRHHLGALRPGGLAVMMDYDIGVVRTEPPLPLMDRLRELVIGAFQAAGAHPLIGGQLQDHLTAAGAADVHGFGIAQYLPTGSPIGPPMLAGVVRALVPVMVSHGLATEAEVGAEDVEERIAAAVREANAVVLPPVLGAAWGRRPTPPQPRARS